MSHASRGPPTGARFLSSVWHGPRTIDKRSSGRSDTVCLPHASRDRAGGAGFVSHLRHGTGIPHSDRRRRNESRACGYDTPLLDQSRLDGSHFFSRYVRDDSGRAGATHTLSTCAYLAAVGPCYPCCSLGGLALFPARLGFDHQSQPQHVHLDRYRHGDCLCVQRDRHSLSRPLPCFIPYSWWARWPSTSRRPR